MSEPNKLNIYELRNAYERGENITQILSTTHPGLDRSEIIEIAYDIQSGSYTRAAIEKPECLRRYACEIDELSRKFFADHDVILDCGAGELTTLSALSLHLPAKCQLLACDISLSRLRAGRRFAERIMRGDIVRDLTLFVADMARLPLSMRSSRITAESSSCLRNYYAYLEGGSCFLNPPGRTSMRSYVLGCSNMAMCVIYLSTLM